MGNLIEHGDSGNQPQVSVGDGDAEVSIKIYQDVYHQVTGRTEQIRRRYRNDLLVEFSDIEQLHKKIMQLCDLHNIVASNEVVSVFHSKERKEQFTSFERFRSYNASATSPTVNVVLKYNFSILPVGTSRPRPQEYVVTVRLSSRVAMFNEIEAEASPFMRGRFIGHITANTAEITVEYADYVLARGFLEAFHEWVKGCHTSPPRKWVKSIQRWSHFIPRTIKLVVAIAVMYFSLEAVPGVFVDPVDPRLAARFLILFGGSFYLLVALGALAGSLIEDAIDSYTNISYLKLNSGDKKIIKKFSDRKRSIVLKFVVGSFLTIILGVVSSAIAELI